MPTRIIFRDPEEVVPGDNLNSSTRSSPDHRKKLNSSFQRFSVTKSSLLNINTKSLILKNAHKEHNNSITKNDNNSNNNLQDTISYRDIAASPRLTGYLFTFTAYVVLLVSSVKFEDPIDLIEDIEDVNESTNSTLLPSANSAAKNTIRNIYRVSKWKRQASVIGSAIFVTTIVFIILAHVDTLFFPNLWRHIFRDTSRIEAGILTFLMSAAGFMVYVSTSSRGIGGFVGYNYNVYFSSWLGWVACCYTFQIWFQVAKPKTVSEILSKFNNKSIIHWSLTLFFSTITLFSLLDIFYASGGIIQWRKRTQLTMIIAAGSSMFCCVVALIINIFMIATRGPSKESMEKSSNNNGGGIASSPTQQQGNTNTSPPTETILSTTPTMAAALSPITRTTTGGGSDDEQEDSQNQSTQTPQQMPQQQHAPPAQKSYWYLVEGLLLLIVASFWIFVVFGFTGVTGLVNGPSNAYFGAWGSCFCSILTVGSWLKEHNNFALSS